MFDVFKKKKLLIVIITIIIAVVMVMSSKGISQFTFINNIFGSLIAPVQSVISLIEGKVSSVTYYYGDIEAIKKENEDLKVKIDVLEKEKNDLLELRNKNIELRNALNIKDQFSNYEVMGANIIAKDLGNWFNVFTIDRGSKDGLAKALPVITSKGLVGMITNSTSFTSKVETIIDEDSAVSARISKTRDLVVIKGDLTLKDQGLCKMDYIPLDIDIAVGDTVETSGLGNIFPKGVIIGKILKVMKEDSELTRYALIQPVVDFKRLEEVVVLKAKNTVGSGNN